MCNVKVLTYIYEIVNMVAAQLEVRKGKKKKKTFRKPRQMNYHLKWDFHITPDVVTLANLNSLIGRMMHFRKVRNGAMIAH